MEGKGIGGKKKESLYTSVCVCVKERWIDSLWSKDLFIFSALELFRKHIWPVSLPSVTLTSRHTPLTLRTTPETDFTVLRSHAQYLLLKRTRTSQRDFLMRSMQIDVHVFSFKYINSPSRSVQCPLALSFSCPSWYSHISNGISTLSLWGRTDRCIRGMKEWKIRRRESCLWG